MKLINTLDGHKVRIVAVDFDGTLCQRESFPQIGEPRLELISWLKDQQQRGVKLILWTCRENEHLADAVAWCAQFGLQFDAVNDNVASSGLQTRKVFADLYIDDRACIPTYN